MNCHELSSVVASKRMPAAAASERLAANRPSTHSSPEARAVRHRAVQPAAARVGWLVGWLVGWSLGWPVGGWSGGSVARCCPPGRSPLDGLTAVSGTVRMVGRRRRASDDRR